MAFRQRTVTGIIKDTSGTPVKNASLEFNLDLPIGATIDTVIVNRSVSTSTDEDGNFTIDLWCDEDSLIPINYKVNFPVSDLGLASSAHTAEFSLLYEDGSPADIGTLITLSIPNPTSQELLTTLIGAVAVRFDVEQTLTPEQQATARANIGAGGGLASIVEDTTPQLGGNLDLNGFLISGVSSTELGYLIGLEGNIQDALDNKQPYNPDLTAITTLTLSNNDILQRKSGVWTNRTPAQFKSDLSLTKSDVGLSNVDNTSDANKPISTATQTALNAKAPLDSPALTGTPTAPTPPVGTNTTQIATTAYVVSEISSRAALLDVMVYKGAIDASGNPNYPAANRGETYRISVAGKVGGASGVNVEAGDMLICNTDSSPAGTQAAVGAHWDIVQANLHGSVLLDAAQTLTNKTLVSPLINLGSDEDGDIYYRNSGAFSRLPKGTDGQVLKLISGLPAWANESGGGGGLASIVEDTTPQLGGHLDVNGFNIVSTSNGNIRINPDGTGDFIIGTNKFIIDSDMSRVGINTLPEGTLSIQTPTAEQDCVIVDSSGNPSSHIKLKVNGTTTFSLVTNTEQAFFDSLASGDVFFRSNGGLSFSAGGTSTANQAMYINSAKRLGLGTTSPGASLPDTFANHADSIFMEISSISSSGDAGLFLRRLDNNVGLDLWADSNTGSSHIDSRHNSNINFRINAAVTPTNIGAFSYNGGVNGFGVGTTTPTGKIHAVGSNSTHPVLKISKFDSTNHNYILAERGGTTLFSVSESEFYATGSVGGGFKIQYNASGRGARLSGLSNSLWLSGMLRFDYSTTSLTANQDALAINNSNVGRYINLTSNGAYYIGSLNVGVSGNPVESGNTYSFINNSSYNITFKHEHLAQATASYRFHTLDGNDLVLAPYDRAEVVYDGYLQRFRIWKLGSTGGGGGGGLGSLVEDTSPQLGGDLDLNGFQIEGVSASEIGYLSGVTGNIQSALNAKASLTGATFVGDIVVPDDAYDEGAWNGNNEVPTKNAIRNKIESLTLGTEAASILGVDSLEPSFSQGIIRQVNSSGRVFVGKQDNTYGELVQIPEVGSFPNAIIGINGDDSDTELKALTEGTGIVIEHSAGEITLKSIKVVQVVLHDNTTAATIGDGAGNFYWTVPNQFDGYKFVRPNAYVSSAGTTGTLEIQVHNVDNAVDLLVDKISIDSGELNSLSAATLPSVDDSNNTLAAGDRIRFDIDAIHSTPSQGLTIEFELEK